MRVAASPGQRAYALLSAEDFALVVAGHADRVHDLVLRYGCPPGGAAEVVAATALDLLDALASAPETVPDLAGWWFANAAEVARRAALSAPEAAPPAAPAGLLAAAEAEAHARAALDALVDRERAAVLLRDAYDLPLPTVAVALRRPPEAASALLATARLHLAERLTGRPAAVLGEHPARPGVTPAVLSELVDGSLPAPRVPPVRRHLAGCPACERMADELAHARAALAALPILALAEEAREAMLAEVGARAQAMLPTPAQVAAAAARAVDPPRSISLLLVVLVLLAAGVAGAAVGVLL